MRIRNPSRRPVRLEVLNPHGPNMPVTIGAGATLDVDKYMRALESLAYAARYDDEDDEP